jgi:HEAT repeat protein
VVPLIAVLESMNSNEYTKAEVAIALGKIGDARAVEPLFDSIERSRRLERSGEQLREDAVRALTMIGTPAMKRAESALSDNNENVRKAASEVLDQLGWFKKCVSIGAPAVEPLIKALGCSKNYSAPKDAISALINIGTPAVEPLMRALDDSSPTIAKYIVEALVGIGDPRAIEPLRVKLSNKHESFDTVVIDALSQLGWQPTCDEAGACYWIQNGEFEKCVSIGAPAVEPLINALKSNNPAVQIAAMSTLGKIGDSRAVEHLIEALRDGCLNIRKAAVEELVRFYKSGNISDAQKQRIMNCKPQITQEHHDSDSGSPVAEERRHLGFTSNCRHVQRGCAHPLSACSCQLPCLAAFKPS